MAGPCIAIFDKGCISHRLVYTREMLLLMDSRTERTEAACAMEGSYHHTVYMKYARINLKSVRMNTLEGSDHERDVCILEV